MQTTPQHLPPLAEYDDLTVASEKLKPYYPTLDSLRWAIRRHRDHFAACGALILVAGRQRLHVKLIEKAIVEIGRSDALKERDA
jgi:hypothetical protein